MPNVLVTGITGRSGKFFGEEIIKNSNGYHIVAIARNTDKFNKMYPNINSISCIKGNIDDYQFMLKAFKDNSIDTLFHIAGISHSPLLVKAAVESGTVNRIIVVHTTGIYSKYKAAGEKYRNIESDIHNMIKNTNITLTILRPTMIYGTLNDSNISTFVRMVDKLRLFPVVSGGKFALQPVNHRDLGLAYYQILMKPKSTDNKDYILSGGTEIDLIDILKNISIFLNKKTHFVFVPFWLAYCGSVILYCITLKRVDFREKVQRLVEPRAFSHKEATTDFGYEPMNFLSGLKDEVELYKSAKSK